MCFDAANSRSYTSGNTWTDLTNNSTANDGNSLTDSNVSQFSHIAVYSRALSATKVKQLYYATKRRLGY